MRNTQNLPVIRAIAAEIKARRADLKISQEELAHRAEVHRSFIARLEVHETQPSASVLFKIAYALETDFQTFAKCIEIRFYKEINSHK